MISIRLDFILFLIIFLLVTIGIIFCFSSDIQINQNLSFRTRYIKQIIFACFGFTMIWIISFIDYRKITWYSFLLYGAMIIILINALIGGRGTSISNAKRWISLGFINIQPSEFLKITMILFMGNLLYFFRQKINDLKYLFFLLAIGFFPVGLVLLQPDMGTAMVFIPIYLTMFLMTGLKKKYFFYILFFLFVLTLLPLMNILIKNTLDKNHFLFALTSKKAWIFIIVLLFVIFVAFTSLAVFSRNLFIEYFSIFLLFLFIGLIISFFLEFYFLKNYQKMRIFSFLFPNLESNRFKESYHIFQSITTIGSGGLTGKGLFRGLQVQLGFLPARGTDFIFAVIAEEVGFIGCFIVLMLFLTMIYLMVNITKRSKNQLPVIINSGIITMFIVQIYINIGMTIGLSPITGLPLPFITYGGSTLLASCLSMGIIFSTYRYRFVNTTKEEKGLALKIRKKLN